MPDRYDPSLEERLERLERTVQALQQQVEALARERTASNGTSSRRADGASAPAPPSEAPTPTKKRSSLSDRVAPHLSWESEDWLNRIGIGLLLFGVAFLFKYTVDQGWITPAVRVGFGTALGLGLLGSGLRLRPERSALGQVLLGGGIAVLYATAFAAYQLYGLIAYPVAFAWMVGVTLLAFVLSVRQGDPVLSVIGVLGGLGTPFFLYTEAGSLPGLVGYTSLILAGAAALFLRAGWRAPLVTASAGSWLVFGFAHLDMSFASETPFVYRTALQAGVVLAWACGSVVPVFRCLRESHTAPASSPQSLGRLTHLLRPLPLLVLLTPLLTAVYSHACWTPVPTSLWGVLLIGSASLYGAAYIFLGPRAVPGLSAAIGLAAALLLAWGLDVLLDGPALLLALAIEAAALLAATMRQPDLVLNAAAHALFLLVGLQLARHFVETGGGLPAVLNARLLTELGVIAAGAGTATLLTGQRRLTYLLAAHGLLLAWLYRAFAPLPDGQAFVSIAWAAYAIVLLVLGFVRDTYLLRTTALATIILIVVKLFLIDLAQLPAIWRILLFLGFGGVFLLLSYYLPGLWKNRPSEPVQE